MPELPKKRLLPNLKALTATVNLFDIYICKTAGGPKPGVATIPTASASRLCNPLCMCTLLLQNLFKCTYANSHFVPLTFISAKQWEPQTKLVATSLLRTSVSQLCMCTSNGEASQQSTRTMPRKIHFQILKQ